MKPRSYGSRLIEVWEDELYGPIEYSFWRGNCSTSFGGSNGNEEPTLVARQRDEDELCMINFAS